MLNEIKCKQDKDNVSGGGENVICGRLQQSSVLFTVRRCHYSHKCLEKNKLPNTAVFLAKKKEEEMAGPVCACESKRCIFACLQNKLTIT